MCVAALPTNHSCSSYLGKHVPSLFTEIPAHQRQAARCCVGVLACKRPAMSRTATSRGLCSDIAGEPNRERLLLDARPSSTVPCCGVPPPLSVRARVLLRRSWPGCRERCAWGARVAEEGIEMNRAEGCAGLACAWGHQLAHVVRMQPPACHREAYQYDMFKTALLCMEPDLCTQIHPI